MAEERCPIDEAIIAEATRHLKDAADALTDARRVYDGPELESIALKLKVAQDLLVKIKGDGGVNDAALLDFVGDVVRNLCSETQALNET